MRSLDRLFENSSRSLARHTSRRSMLATLGKILTGAALIPLLPVDRSSRAQAGENEGGRNKLLEQQRGERLDGGTAQATVGSDTTMEAMAAIHRPADSEG